MSKLTLQRVCESTTLRCWYEEGLPIKEISKRSKFSVAEVRYRLKVSHVNVDTYQGGKI